MLFIMLQRRDTLILLGIWLMIVVLVLIYNKIMNMENTAYQLACQNGHLECIKLLSLLNPNREYFNKTGWHAIHYAAQGGHANIIEYLVNDFDVSIDLQQDNEYGDTAYQLACRNGHLECIKLLSSLNPNREYFNKTSWHAIHYAAEKGHANIIGYLVNDCSVSIDFTTR